MTPARRTDPCSLFSIPYHEPLTEYNPTLRGPLLTVFRYGVRRPVSERFFAKVDRTLGFGPAGDCHRWTGAHNGHYGHLALTNMPGELGLLRMAYAHRLAYELAHGAIPEGLHVLHRCDVPLCVNPAHLWLGTHRDNMADARRKGRFDRPRPSIATTRED